MANDFCGVTLSSPVETDVSDVFCHRISRWRHSRFRRNVVNIYLHYICDDGRGIFLRIFPKYLNHYIPVVWNQEVPLKRSYIIYQITWRHIPVVTAVRTLDRPTILLLSLT
jgi:hypothetical protein